MKIGSATGNQIAFLTFALLLLIVPVTRFVTGLHPWSPAEAALIQRSLPFLVMAAVLFGFARLRRLAAIELARPVPPDRRREVLVVGLASLAKAFAWAGIWVMGWWMLEGPVSAEQHLRLLSPHDAQMARAATMAEWMRSIVVAGILGPILEELVFRGFLFRAWERQWGWIASMLLTSTLFALYHPNFVPAFAASVLYVCLYRRTGSLWAPIAVHSFFNVASFYPFLGRFVFQRHREVSGDPGDWGLQIACLLFVAIALPLYAWMSRDPPRYAAFAAQDHGAVPK